MQTTPGKPPPGGATPGQNAPPPPPPPPPSTGGGGFDPDLYDPNATNQPPNDELPEVQDNGPP